MDYNKWNKEQGTLWTQYIKEYLKEKPKLNKVQRHEAKEYLKRCMGHASSTDVNSFLYFMDNFNSHEEVIKYIENKNRKNIIKLVKR